MIYTFPKSSIAILFPTSLSAPPSCFAQIKFPESSCLQTNISIFDAVKFKTPGPGSKSTVPLKKPVEYILPLLSTVISFEKSLVLEPTPNAQSKEGVCEKEANVKLKVHRIRSVFIIMVLLKLLVNVC